MKSFYIRLLTYEKAMNIIGFINEEKLDYAHITPGGVAVASKSEDKTYIVKELNTYKVPYEISNEQPHVTTSKIVEKLKYKGVI